MAEIHITELRSLLQKAKNWSSKGELSPTELFAISLTDNKQVQRQVLDSSLAKKHITFESHVATVVLDFDEFGYLTHIEFV